MQQRRAIALLITVMFVMIISVAIGYGLQQLNNASRIVKQEQNLYQNSMIVEDVLEILKQSKELSNLIDNNATEDLYSFLSTAAYIPLDIGENKVIISIQSARNKFNINNLNKKNKPLLQAYFNKMMVSDSYIELLSELTRKVETQEEYNNYKSILFDKYPALFREYIASKKHLEIINRFYRDEYKDESINNVAFDKLFSFSKDTNRSIDLNYARSEVWELILDTSKQRAQRVYQGSGSYKSIKDLHLSQREKESLSHFKTSFFEPYLRVDIQIIDQEESSRIHFEYDIRAKRGYDFVFEI